MKRTTKVVFANFLIVPICDFVVENKQCFLKGWWHHIALFTHTVGWFSIRFRSSRASCLSLTLTGGPAMVPSHDFPFPQLELQ